MQTTTHLRCLAQDAWPVFSTTCVRKVWLQRLRRKAQPCWAAMHQSAEETLEGKNTYLPQGTSEVILEPLAKLRANFSHQIGQDHEAPTHIL